MIRLSGFTVVFDSMISKNFNGKTRRGFLLTAGFLLLMLPLLLAVLQQEQEIRQHATELSFKTLAPGSSLPTEADCASKVRRATWEPRPENATANNKNVYAEGYRLSGSELAQYGTGYEDRVTGNFTGTTDEIIQWAACKWGFDEQTVRAQAAAESSWQQMLLGKCLGGQVQPDTNSCHSVGIMQVTAANIPPSHPGTWPYARTSTAFNIDYTLAIRRACFEGKLSMPGVGYQAGNEWGCIGQWNTGAWHNTKAEAYIAKVRKALANNVWNTYGAGPLPTFPIISEPVLSQAPTVALSPTSPYLTPPFFCLAAPCPTVPEPTTIPSAAPTIAPTIEPTEPVEPSPEPTISSEPDPTIVEPSIEVTISPFPTEDPCNHTSSIAHSKHKSKHRHHNGGVSDFMEQLLKFFMELINMLLKLIGNPNPNPNPNPAPTPGTEPNVTENPLDPDPTSVFEEPTIDPCAPTVAPSEEPEPSIVEPTEPAVVPTTVVSLAPSTTVPSGSVLPSVTVQPSAATTPGSVSPTLDPCEPAAASIAHSRKKSKHKKAKHGFFRKFIKFFFDFFIELLKRLGQQPGKPNPVPSPMPSVVAPTISDEPILTLEPTSEEPIEPSATLSEAPVDPCPSSSPAPEEPSIAPSESAPSVVPSIVAPSITIVPPTAAPSNTGATPTVFFNLQRGR